MILYRDKPWLDQKYAIEEFSCTDLASLCFVTPRTIWLWLKRFNIKTRNNSESKKIWHQKNPHPRGMLGKHHSEESKQKKREANLRFYKNNPEFLLERKGKHEGELNPNWRGGVIVDDDGYIRIKKKNHPYADSHGYVLEHRLIAEKALGRFLKPEETIHHMNTNKRDNRKENLLISLNGYHIFLHRRLRKINLKGGA